MTHYVKFICLYRSAQSFDTAYSEAAHKFLIKIFFFMTNKVKNWKSQILLHNIQHHNISVMNDLLLYWKTKIKSTAVQQLCERSIKAARDSMKLTMISHSSKDEEILCALCQNQKQWWRAWSVAESCDFQCHSFLETLTVFIQKHQKKLNDMKCDDANLDTWERDSSWVDDYYIEIHKSLICWRHDSKNATDLNELQKKKVWCTLQWWKWQRWHRDCVWMQEHDSDVEYQNIKTARDSSRQMRRLQLIVSVLDHEQLETDERSEIYTEAFIDVMHWVNKRATDKIHGMFEAEIMSVSTVINSRALSSWWFYDLSHIICSVHLVSVNEQCTRFYVNNFIDWDQYNTIYDSDFLNNSIRIADQWAKNRK